MQLSIISPTPWLEKFTSQSDLHLVLAHKVLEDKAYAEYYAKETKFKILDNSVYELGHPMSAEDLAAAALIINPDEIAYPDYAADAFATLEASKKFHTILRDRFPGKRRMIIPQGSNAMEWMWCLKELLDLNKDISPENITIGIGFQNCSVFCSVFNTSPKEARCKLASYLAAKLPYSIHLLGGGDNPIEIAYHDRDPKIRSLDSAVPLIAGASMELFDEITGWERNKRKLDWDNTRYSSEQLRIIQANIDMMRDWAGNR